jgi:hypothetical protein
MNRVQIVNQKKREEALGNKIKGNYLHFQKEIMSQNEIKIRNGLGKIRNHFTLQIFEHRQFIASIAYCKNASLKNATIQQLFALIELIKCTYGVKLSCELDRQLILRCFEIVKYLDNTMFPYSVILRGILEANFADIKSLCFLSYRFIFNSSLCLCCYRVHLEVPCKQEDFF